MFIAQKNAICLEYTIIVVAATAAGIKINFNKFKQDPLHDGTSHYDKRCNTLLNVTRHIRI